MKNDSFWQNTKEERERLADCIIAEYKRILSCVNRLTVRLFKYKVWSESAQATCDADDALYEIQKQLKKLENALREM